ncbi:MAG: WbqC family protein [Culturomica sp.]|jgi:hypothetical protein|nr:WbqC family protein [Culturomica sp.]
MSETICVTTAYYPPVQYFFHMGRHPAVWIEQYESYGKQSYRNRCRILSANGVLTLSVPVSQKNGGKFLTREAEIDYSENWQRLHLRTIASAYKNSPFYDYYIDELRPFFEKKERYLLDLNNAILSKLLEIIGLQREIHLTEEYVAVLPEGSDLREVIHPKEARRKAPDPLFTARPYTQTFAERFPFEANLSILDLLFCTGPEATAYL